MNPEVFIKYDEEHPEIWVEFDDMALKLIGAGRSHYGAKAIMEVIRYHTIISGGADFKINNNYTSGYARKFMRKHPEHEGFFELRGKHGTV